LEAQLRAQRIALVLRYRKRPGSLQERTGLVAQEQPAGHRQPSNTDHVAVADLAAERTKRADLDFRFESMHCRAAERDGETHAGIEQDAVIGEIIEAAAVPVPIDAHSRRHTLRKAHIDKVAV